MPQKESEAGVPTSSLIDKNEDVEPFEKNNIEKCEKIMEESTNPTTANIREEPFSDLRTFIVDSPGNATVVLDNINIQNTVQDLMLILQEYPMLSQYTAYHLDAVTLEKTKNKKKKNKNRKIVESCTLDLFSQVADLPNKQRLRIVPDNYNPTSGRLHVRQLRSILKTEVPVNSDNGGVDSALILPSQKQSSNTANEGREAKTPEQKTPEELKREAQKKVLELYKKIDDSKLPVDGKLSLFFRQSNIEKETNNTTIGEATTTQINGGTKNSDNKNKHEISDDEMKSIECVRTISFSEFNPPPRNRRMMGDYFYLQVETLESKTYHVTCTASGFFVNSTKYNTFDPSPMKSGKNAINESHTLADLLKQISPSFKRCYSSLIDTMERVRQNVQVNDPWHTLLKTAELENVQLSPEWNVQDGKGSNSHHRDMNRAEDHLLGMYGLDERGSMRDWNEEYQQCKDMPTTNIGEKVMRARALYKVEQDFTAAARKGAEAIMSGFVQPINPMDQPNSYVYVFNNIFFSLSVPGAGRDSAADVSSDNSTNVAKNENSVDAIISLKHDLQGVLALNNADVPGLHTLATCVMDYMGKRIVAQSIIPGILQGEETTKLVYGSVDQGRTIASNPHMHELMKKACSRLLIGERIVTPLSHANEEENSQSEITDKGDQEEEKVSDVLMKGAGSDPVKLCGPVDCKGIYGSDGRYYMLDLVRITPKDCNFDPVAKNVVKKNGDKVELLKEDEKYFKNKFGTEDGAKPTRMYLLRPELAQIYNLRRQEEAKAKAIQEYKEKKKKKEEAEKDQKKSESDAIDNNVDTKDSNSKDDNSKETKENELIEVRFTPLNMNINTYGDNVYAVDRAGKNVNQDEKVDNSSNINEIDIKKNDEAVVYNLSVYLRKLVLPQFIKGLRSRSIRPYDGESLCVEMHGRGINIRYLGMIATELHLHDNLGQKDSTDGLSVQTPYDVKNILEIEMITRSCRHYLSSILRSSDIFQYAPGPFVARFLSLLLGNGTVDDYDAMVKRNNNNNTNERNKNGKKKNKKNNKNNNNDYHGVTTPVSLSTLKAAIDALPKTREELWRKVQNEVSERFTNYELKYFGAGSNNTLQDYKLPLLRRLCQKLGIRIQSRHYNFSVSNPIHAGDIIDLIPVVKHGFPKTPLSEIHQLLEVGRVKMGRLRCRESLDVLQEALMLLYQTVGVLHNDVASCCQMISTCLFREGDIESAIVQQRRAITIYERLHGLDSAYVVQGYDHLATLYHQKYEHDMAIKFGLKSIYYQKIMCGGFGNSTLTNGYIKLGNMYQEAQHFKAAVHCYNEAIRLSSDNPLDSAHCYHLLAVLSSVTRQHKGALEFEQRGYKILKTLLGPDSPRTKQAFSWVKKFTQNVVVTIKATRGLAEEKKREKALQDLLRSDISKSKKKQQGGKMKKKKKK